MASLACPLPAIAAETVTVEAEADAWVSDDAPDANHGSDSSLQVKGSQPVSNAFLRFNPTLPDDAVVIRTTLRLHFASASSSSLDIKQATSNGWDEGSITFNNAPSLPIFPTRALRIAAGWDSFYVLPFEGGRITYGLTRTGAESASFESREGLNRPQLVIEYTRTQPTPRSVCSSTGCVESKPWIYTMSWATTIADFNGDGLDDHLVGRHLETDQVHLQQPNGTFTPGFALPPWDRHSCAAGDINLDGRTDLFCQVGAGSGEGTKQDEVWIARPDGRFVNEGAAWGPRDPYGRGRRPILFDFDNDGGLDLYTTSIGGRPDGQRSENVLWLNRGDPKLGGMGFVEKRVSATGSWGEECVADGDWNRDAFRDFLVCGPHSTVALHLFENENGSDTLPADSLLGAAVNSPRDATLADLNRDGWDDLLIVRAGELQIRINAACAACARFADVQHRVPLVDGRSVAVGDVTGDGHEDIYVVEGSVNDQNAEDLLLAGPDWTSLPMPQAEHGHGDTAEVMEVAGRKNFVVTNGYSPGSYFIRGPVQFISFLPHASVPPPTAGAVPSGTGSTGAVVQAPQKGLTKKAAVRLSARSAKRRAKRALRAFFGKRLVTRTLRMRCQRRSSTRFRCNVRWTSRKQPKRGAPRRRYSGAVTVTATQSGVESGLRIKSLDLRCARRTKSKRAAAKRCLKRYEG